MLLVVSVSQIFLLMCSAGSECPQEDDSSDEDSSDEDSSSQGYLNMLFICLLIEGCSIKIN